MSDRWCCRCENEITHEAVCPDCAGDKQSREAARLLSALKMVLLDLDATSHHIPAGGWHKTLMADSEAAHALVREIEGKP